MNDRTQPIALVTGGSRGLGRSIALHLAEAGVDVIVTYQARAADAETVVGELRGRGRRAAALALDVGRAETFEAFAATLRQTLEATFGRARLDYLVNNAGHGVYAPIATTTEAEFDGLLNVPLKGPYFLTQRLLPLMNDGGAILNLSTGLARFSYPGYAAYAAAKGGLEVFTRYLAAELGPRRIRVNTLAPGAIETDFGGGAVRDNPALNAQIAGQTALGRVGQAEDVGRAAVALLGPGGQWINGQRIEVSGGVHL